jgi:hypothetical protein
MSISGDLDSGLVFFKGFKTSSNSLELASEAKIWQFEERRALIEDPT